MKSINLYACPFVSDVRVLSKCAPLEKIWLENCINVSDIAELAKCPWLRTLNVMGTQVSDVSMFDHRSVVVFFFL